VGQCLGDGCADAGRGTGHQRDLVLKAEHPLRSAYFSAALKPRFWPWGS
jgi:hypothetical protein